MSIELRGVSKKFGEVAAVNDVNFAVSDGELMALLGPSGGGKTTVLRMIAGLEVPTEGDIFVRGERVNDLPVQKRNIGFVFQSYALFKNMTVFKNIAFGLKIKKWKKAEAKARVMEMLEIFGLSGLEHRYPHQLSGGQRQRVAIARSLAPKPSVLLARRTFWRGGREDPPGAARVACDFASRLERDDHLRHARSGGSDGGVESHRHLFEGQSRTD